MQSKDLKGKMKEDVVESDKANNEIPTGRYAKEEDDFSKKGIFAEEAIEFLRII